MITETVVESAKRGTEGFTATDFADETGGVFGQELGETAVEG